MSRQIEQCAAGTANGGLRITVDDLTGPAVISLRTEHLVEMAEHSPADSMHALDLAALRHPGVASTLLRHLIAEATARGYRRLSLETGAPDFFRPARRLYAAHGFDYCAPFGDYRPDPNSVFMTRML